MEWSRAGQDRLRINIAIQLISMTILHDLRATAQKAVPYFILLLEYNTHMLQ